MGSAKSRRQTRRRRTTRRVPFGRRRVDIWQSVAKLVGCVAFGTGAILGQAELIGEPTRHYVTIICIAAFGVFTFLMGPQHVQVLLAQVGKLKGKA